MVDDVGIELFGPPEAHTFVLRMYGVADGIEVFGIPGRTSNILWRARFPATADGDREIIWPKDVVPEVKAPYCGTGGREHGDVPLPELAGLADALRAKGLEDEEDLIRGIQEHFGLGRLAISARQRFEAAVRAE